MRALHHPKNKKLTAKKILFFLFILSALIFNVDILNQERLSIKNIVIENNETVDKDELIKIASQTISGKYLGLYKKDNLLIWPRKKLEENIISAFERIKNISTRREKNDLVIRVEERVPKYLWCPNNAKDCFYLDEDGFGFDAAPSFSGEVYLKLLGTTDSFKDKQLGQIMESNKFETLMNFHGFLSKIISENFSEENRISAIKIKENSEYEFIISSTDEGLWSVLFSLSDSQSDIKDIGTIAKNFQAAVSSPFFSNGLNSNERELEYIDLRFGRKIFYKFLNEEAGNGNL